MSHFAEIDANNIVLRVIVAEQDFVDAQPGTFIQTSYNATIRKNFAGIGFAYNKKLDAFIPLSPFKSWSLNEATCQWEAPVSKPENAVFWDEGRQSWGSSK
jgi:hypothetical protein